MIRKLQPEIKEELPNETQNTKYSTATTHSAQLNHGRVMTSLLKMATSSWDVVIEFVLCAIAE